MEFFQESSGGLNESIAILLNVDIDRYLVCTVDRYVRDLRKTKKSKQDICIRSGMVAYSGKLLENLAEQWDGMVYFGLRERRLHPEMVSRNNKILTHPLPHSCL